MNIPFRKHLMDGSRQYRDMSPEEFYDLAGDGRTTETVKDNADAIADHTADMVAHMTQSQKNQLAAAVPNTRTINGHALSGNVIITKSDVGLGNVDNTAAPTKLPNPYALTFTGGATGSYDGSAAKSIAIPAIEYGTWTPTTTDGTALDASGALYCKIGRLVCVQAFSIGADDGVDMSIIEGLPYSISASDYKSASGTIAQSISHSGNPLGVLLAKVSHNRLYLTQNGDFMDPTDMKDISLIYSLSVTYIID